MKLSQDQQNKILAEITELITQYRDLNKPRSAKMVEIYKAFSTYEQEQKAEWLTKFKVNKAHEIVERVLPRLIAKNPRWIVSPKSYDFYPEQELPPLDQNNPESVKVYKEALEKKRKATTDYSRAIQDYLEYIFDEYGFEGAIRMFAKTGVVYGKGWAKVGYKYEIARIMKEKELEEEVVETEPKEGEEERSVTIKDNGKEVVEEVVGEHPFIDVKSFTEVMVDPRYKNLADMPGLIEVNEGVRLAQLKKNDNYFNLDKLTDCANLSGWEDSPDTYLKQVKEIAGIQQIDLKDAISKNNLKTYVFYGYLSLDEDGDERMYKITLADQLFVIGCEEITKIPYVDFSCFEDIETNQAVGFVEPILGLQDELNFQKNSAVNFVNQALNRTFLWSANSNIDPRDLISKPYGVIPVQGDVSQAMTNCVELPMRQLPSDYFQFQNDIERQIQGQTFTVDTSNQRSQQALTDTATGMRIEFFESNSVLDQCRKNFEQALSKLAYLLIQAAFENMEDNIVLKKLGADEYWEMNKEVLRNAITRYTIKVEVGSSSFDDIENRRRDAMAFFNMLMQAKQAGANVEIDGAVKDTIETFEKRDASKFIKAPDVMALAGQLPPLPPSGTGNMPPQQVDQAQAANPAAQLTQDVAQGDLQSIIPQ